MAKSGKKIKKIKRVLLISALTFAVLAAVIFFFGGSGFRWFGSKTEKVGEVVKEKSGEIGKPIEVIFDQPPPLAAAVEVDLKDASIARTTSRRAIESCTHEDQIATRIVSRGRVK